MQLHDGLQSDLADLMHPGLGQQFRVALYSTLALSTIVNLKFTDFASLLHTNSRVLLRKIREIFGCIPGQVAQRFL
jgi:hypothetical protein